MKLSPFLCTEHVYASLLGTWARQYPLVDPPCPVARPPPRVAFVCSCLLVDVPRESTFRPRDLNTAFGSGLVTPHSYWRLLSLFSRSLARGLTRFLASAGTRTRAELPLTKGTEGGGGPQFELSRRAAGYSVPVVTRGPQALPPRLCLVDSATLALLPPAQGPYVPTRR